MASRAETEASINNDHGLLAKPLHLQRLEQAVRLEPFLNYIENVYSESQSDNEIADEGSRSDFDMDAEIFKEKYNYRQDRMFDRVHLYNFSKVKKNRVWLKDILLSESSDSDDSSDSSVITEEDLHEMLRLHKLQKAAQAEFHKNPELRQFQYYGSGLLSNYDKFYDNQKLVLGGKKLKEKKAEKRKVKLKKGKPDAGKTSKDEQDSISSSKKGPNKNQKSEDHGDTPVQKHHSKKKSSVSHEAVMNMKRRRLWIAIGKKEIGRAQKQMVAAHKETLTVAKKFKSIHENLEPGALLFLLDDYQISSWGVAGNGKGEIPGYDLFYESACDLHMLSVAAVSKHFQLYHNHFGRILCKTALKLFGRIWLKLPREYPSGPDMESAEVEKLLEVQRARCTKLTRENSLREACFTWEVENYFMPTMEEITSRRKNSSCKKKEFQRAKRDLECELKEKTQQLNDKKVDEVLEVAALVELQNDLDKTRQVYSDWREKQRSEHLACKETMEGREEIYLRSIEMLLERLEQKYLGSYKFHFKF